MANNNTLMFQIGIQEVKETIDAIRKKFDEFDAKYGSGGGITVKLNLSGAVTDAESLLNALKNIGNPDSLKPYEQEINNLKKKIKELQDALEKSGSSGKGGGKKQEEDLKSLATQYSKIISTIENKQANLSKLLAGGNSKYFSTEIKEAINAYQQLIERVKLGFYSDPNSASLKEFRQILGKLNTDFANVNKGAALFNKATTKSASDSAKAAARENQVWADSMDLAKTKANTLKIEIDRLSEVEKKASLLGVDTTAFKNQIDILKQNLSTLYGMMGGSKMGGTAQEFVSSAAFKVPLQNIKEIERIITDVSKTTAQKDAAIEKFFEKMANSSNKAGIAISDLQKRFEHFRNNGVFQKAIDLKIDTTQYQHAIEQLLRYQRVLQYIKDTGGVHDASRITGSAGYREMINNLEIQLGRLRQKVTETERAQAANMQLAESEQQLAKAIKGSTDSMRGQSQVLSDLKSMAMQYLSVWGAQNFINNIIEIGGQLEKQRLSISAILQDAAHGEDLFDKIKRLAVQSPFGVVELDQFTKQLSAYGFKYNELYDMTKRLADISAGAGTEVSRLALALGHVRAEGALSGYTLRQFAMNNIPMVSELAKKLSEVEGHLVTTADVRKRVSNKEIGYQDVEDVIKKLTNEGGMFFRMQEVISESVQAKFKNLRDSFDIMYGEIAKSTIGDFLKEIATTLTKMTRSWKSFIPIIESVGIAFAAYRGSLLLTNATMGKNTAAMHKSILAAKQKRAADLESMATIRALTPWEQKLIANKNALTAADLRAAMASKQLTKDEALRLVALRKLTIEEAAAAVNMGLFSEAEVMAARSSSLLMTRIKMLGLTLKTSLLSVLSTIFNKWNALFAVLSIGMSLYQDQQQYNEDRKERIEELWQRSREGQKNLGEMKATYKVGMSAELDKDGLRQAISDLKEKLKDYTPDVNKVFNEAFAVKKDGSKNIKSLAEQYEVLAKALEDTEKAYTRLTTIRVSVDDAIEATQVKHKIFGVEFNNPFDKNVVDNIKKYAEAYNEADKSMMAFMRDYHDEIQKGLLAAGKRFLSTDLEGMENAVRNLKRGSTEEIKFYRELYKLSGESDDASYGAWGDWIKSNKELKESWSQTSNDIMTMGNRLFKNLSTRWGSTVKNWTTDQKMAVYMVFDEIIGKEMEASGVAEDVQKRIRSLFMEPFGVDFRTETEAAYEEINALKKYLEGLTSNAWVIKMKVETSDSADIVADQQKKLKEASGNIKETKERLKKAGLIGKSGELYLHRDLSETEQQMVDDLKKYQEAEQNSKKVLDAYHADYESAKDKKKHERQGRGEDAEAKRLREIVKLYKDAYDWYVKYEKQVGEGSALKKVQEQFQPLFDEFNKQWNTNLSLDSIPKYSENLVSLLDEALGLYQQKIHKNNYMVDAIKVIRDAINNVGYEELGREQEEFFSKTQIELDNLTRSWETFNSVREATGNINLAMQLSGAEYVNGRTRNLADAVKEKIERDFSAANAVSIPFDINLSDKEIEEQIKKAMPKESEDRIKGLVEEYKKWRDLQRDVLKQDINTFAKLIGSSVDYESQLKKINDELEKQIEANEEIANTDPSKRKDVDNANDIATIQAVEKAWKLRVQYSELFNNSLALTENELQNGVNVAMAIMNEKLRLGRMTAQEYADEMAKLRKIMQDFNANKLFGKSNGFTAFLQGGVKGLGEYYERMINHYTAIANDKSRSGSERAEAYYKAADYKNAQKKLDSFTNALGSATVAIDIVSGTLDGFQKAAQTLSDMFDALGKEDAANTWSDVADTIGAIGSTLNGASSVVQNLMSGNIGGTISSVIAAPFETIASPITAFAQLHDKKRERQIEELKREVSKIDNTLNLIKSLRERTLGYDSGNLRRQIAAQYQSQLNSGTVKTLIGDMNVDFNPAATAMLEYYSRGGLEGNGYQQELESLKKQREMYQEMYETEEDKKKSSKEALEEYKQKMAELDMTIQNYAKDLANELYGIDLKGWADQIGDALMNAFENGESAAEAFKDTVQDIMRQVLNKMLSLGIIQPMMERLQKKLFGENGQGGSFDAMNPEGTIDAAMQDVADFFGDGGEGQKMVEAAESFYERWKSYMQSQGLSLENEDASSKTSSSIKSITEQTADLLASYINAIRADVSVNRAMIAQYLPLLHSVMTSGNTSLKNIESHTAAIMRSNDIVADKITNLDNNINGLKNKTWKVPMA